MPRLALIAVSLFALGASGCFFSDDVATNPRDLESPHDAAAPIDIPPPPGGDLATPIDARPALDSAAQDLSAADLASGDLAARDLATPDLASVDLATPDLASTDLAVASPDFSSTDLAQPHFDLATTDAPPCNGGYLNATDPTACPLYCSPLVQPVADEGAFHIPFCTSMTYMHNPPASGNHWPWPAPWGAHTGIVPREWWVHNLEHQGIVLLYNCPYAVPDGGTPKTSPVEGAAANCTTDGGSSYPLERTAVDNCAADIAALQSLIKSHPPDPWGEDRIVVTQDPLLPARFGAVAWDWSYLSSTVDLKALQCFIDARYGRGPEPAP